MHRQKVERLLSRMQEVEAELGRPDVTSDRDSYRRLTTEYSYLSDVKTVWIELEQCRKEQIENEELLGAESDEEFLKMLREELERLEKKIEKLARQLQTLLVPPDPLDHANTILELRAGTGGDEAALFVGDCVRMYRFFADRMGWSIELLSATPSEVGGYKEYILAVSGKNAYRMLRYEGGVHRVQRVPATEAQGRVHTSAITVATLPEAEEEEELVIEERDLRVDTYRASGAGGQHVNTTDSAVRLTHTPTGLVAYSQQERSQHKNKEKAMRLLKAKIAEVERERRESASASSRKTQVGTGDRSERIRTYNFPQNRVTEHRINLTLYSLDRIMQGDLDEVIEALITHFHGKKLTE